ncbi:MAG: Pyruvate/Phosphoenolpyruvate kinase domain protein [Myxococcales bacterium]|nr:Pyruvate/Phosphoenolpyruvate kinase domain protein [Myxococcales bacterium]
MRRYPGDSGARQAVHTVYGGAHLFTSETPKKLGELALRALDTYAPDAATFAEALGIRGELAPKVLERVREKLKREAVEDFRIDFEDGYGNRSDDEEDGHAVAAAQQVGAGLIAGTLPPFIGIRIKPLTRDLAGRSLRTLDVFLTELLGATNGRLPEGFVVTLPKIQTKTDVEVLVEAFEILEDRLDLEPGSLRVEFMVETTQSIFDPQGRSALPRLHRAAAGRLVAAHFGTYDYTANCDITAAHQKMRHPACDFAKHMMKVAFAGTGVQLSDGATNIMPVAPHKGANLTEDQKRDNKAAVYSAWRLHADDVRHSLVNGYYQGWDLHPAQLVPRYGAVYAFFLDGLAPASERLKNFVDKAAQATLVGDVFDDAATGQGLLNYFLRGIACGAVTEQEALATGLSLEEIRSKSFVKIMAARRGKG